MNTKAIITSALPYANGEIHLGHVASTYLPADVTTRFLKQKGVEAYYICASDDFGTPILIQSEKEGKTPEEYVEYWNKRDAEDFAAFDIEFDLFYKTSSLENRQFVQDVFKKLEHAGHIYESEIIQFYCNKDKKFLPDRYVIGTCPYCKAMEQYSDLCEKCGRVPEEIENPHCSICGDAPVKKKTKHYFFKLKNFSDKLSEYLGGNQNLQKDVKKYVQNWIEEGLTDWDITRDISWGVPVPVDGVNDKVFYGWFDNHLAYISSAVKFLSDNGKDGKKFWNESDIYHFIGKDIVYHHYLFLPAMRFGIGEEYKLPDYIPTRGHLTLQAKKISKSRNWYIGLKDFLQIFPADYLRFYLVSINPYSQDDLNFDWDEFATKINSELIGNLGNFVNRALGFTVKAFDSIVPVPEEFDDMDKESEKAIKDLGSEVGVLMEQNHLDRALKKILQFSAHFNQYFQHKEPWKKAHGTGSCVYLSVNAVRSLAIAIYPFLPKSSQKIWVQLGMDGDVSAQSFDEEKNDPIDFALWKFSDAEPSWDSPWGKGRPGWHIECSAMSLKYLGENFEIHGGGRDLIFPHHENEIAQSESSTQKQFAKIWMHVGMITINGEKMSKSVGNVKSVNHVLEDWGPNVIRLFCLSGHYSKPIDYTKDLLKENLVKWRRLEICYYELSLLSTNDFGETNPWSRRVAEKMNLRSDSHLVKRISFETNEGYRERRAKFENEMAEIESRITGSRQKFDAALENDFNTPLALTELFSMIKTINGLVDEQKIPKHVASLALSVLEHMLDVLGLNIIEISNGSIEGIFDLLVIRDMDRNRGNYEEGDKIRNLIVEMGIQLFDHKNRITTWVKHEKIKADTS